MKKNNISMDLPRYNFGNKKIGFISIIFSKPGFRFMFFFRLCQEFKKGSAIGLLARLILKFLTILYGFQIPHSTRIAKGLFLAHWGNIIINRSVVIGENCNISQGVTIGQVNRGKMKGTPVIGDRVWIGTNAVIVGNVKIGNDALIAPLSYVNFNVPPKAVILGNPGKIVSYNSSAGYVNNLA